MEGAEKSECDVPLCECVALRLFEMREHFRNQMEQQRRQGAFVRGLTDPYREQRPIQPTKLD